MPTTDKPLPPGRFGLPWIGETMSIVRSNHGFYTDRFERYGPVFRTRLFGINFVVFSGHEAFHRFATDPAIERGGADPISVEQIFLKSLALVDGPEHRRRKQVMLEGIRTWEAIEAYVSRMQALTEQCVDPWVASGTATAQPDLQLLAARFTAALYTGDPSEAHAREISEVVADMREAFMTLPVPLPGTAYGRAIKARDRLIEIIDEAIASHQKGDFDDIVSRMLSAAEADGVPVESLRGDLLHLIFAGQGGFFVPLTLITLALGEHEDIQARAREEVLEVVPEGPVTLEHLARMQYLDRLAREVRRHYAMNSATFFGRVKEPMEVAGYHIPRGWGAIGAIHITMRNAEEYEDPTRFDPDRFLPERMAARPPGSYVPHGDGDRGGHRCPGEDIVGTAIQLYLAVLLRRARYSLPPQDLTLTNTLFPLPRSGLVLRVQPLEGGG